MVVTVWLFLYGQYNSGTILATGTPSPSGQPDKGWHQGQEPNLELAW